MLKCQPHLPKEVKGQPSRGRQRPSISIYIQDCYVRKDFLNLVTTFLPLSLPKKVILPPLRMRVVLFWRGFLPLQRFEKKYLSRLARMNLLITNKSFDAEEEFTLQDEIEDREDALEELTSILGGSASCPSFTPSGTNFG